MACDSPPQYYEIGETRLLVYLFQPKISNIKEKLKDYYKALLSSLDSVKPVIITQITWNAVQY